MIDICYVGDVRDGLRAFIAAGIRAQTCVTSPPYWGLRDYGAPGQIGLEPTIAEYVATMVDVFRLVRDALTDDGTLWLNLGDSYATGAGKVGNCPGGGAQGEAWARRGVMTSPNRMPQDGLKPKDLCGIPWRVAFALQADGWYLRSDIIWAKPNPMPESVTDRPTKAHEYLFLLSKQERYYYDAAAIAEPFAGEPYEGRQNGAILNGDRADRGRTIGMTTEKRNRRTVWTIATEPYADAHFATFPTALVEPCILAGTSQRGHCPQCGKGWERVVEREFVPQQDVSIEKGVRGHSGTKPMDASNSWQGVARGNTRVNSLGWQPTCDCNAGEPVPGIVLDPFMGSGTVAQVAQSLGRRWIGCELNSQYVEMQKRRAAQLGMELSA